MDLETLEPEPGSVYLLDWPIRTGKTTDTAAWIGSHREKKYIVLCPTLGNIEEGEDGIATTWAAKLRNLDSPVPFSVAAGKAKSCPVWDGAKDDGGLGIRRHRQMTRRYCGEPCETTQGLDEVLSEAAESGFSTPMDGLPQGPTYQHGWCTAVAGRARLLSLDQGEVVLTSPPTFRLAESAARQRGEDFYREWCRDLVLVWDEAHKDEALLHRASLQEELPITLDARSDTTVIPSLLWDLPEGIETYIEEQDDPSELREQIDDFLSRFTRALSSHIKKAAKATRILNRRREKNDIFGSIETWVDRGWSCKKAAAELRKRLKPLPEELSTFKQVLEEQVVSVWEETGDRELEREWALAPGEPASILADMEFTFTDTRDAYIQELGGRQPDLFRRWNRLIWDHRQTIRHLQTALLQLSDDADSNVVERWFEVLHLLEEARQGTFWVDVSLDNRPQKDDSVSFLVLDSAGSGDHVAVGYHSLQRSLDQGASLVMLSATPRYERELESFLGDRDIRRIEFPKDRERPELRVIVEDGTRGIHNTCRFDGDEYRLKDEPKRLVRQLTQLLGMDNVHLLARDKKEAWALKNEGYPEERVHYARDTSTHGGSWIDEEEDWNLDDTIIALGPPWLPLNLWASLRGETERFGNMTLPASQAWQKERMAMEASQALGRGARIGWEGQDAIEGQVILLAGRDAKPVLETKMEEWGIEATWEAVPAAGGMEARAVALVAELKGLPELSEKTRRFLAEWDRGPVISNKKLNEHFSSNRGTCKKVIDELCEAEFAERAEKTKTGKQLYHLTSDVQWAYRDT